MALCHLAARVGGEDGEFPVFRFDARTLLARTEHAKCAPVPDARWLKSRSVYSEFSPFHVFRVERRLFFPEPHIFKLDNSKPEREETVPARPSAQRLASLDCERDDEAFDNSGTLFFFELINHRGGNKQTSVSN